MARSEEWEAAYRRLEELVQELHGLMVAEHAEDGDHPTVPIDYVLVVGYQLYDEDDDRCGGISMFPKDGSQPYYITTGLLHTALNRD